MDNDQAESTDGADRRALFTSLYEAHHRSVYAFALAKTSDRTTSEDLLQEVFLRAWQHVAALAVMSKDRQVYWIFTTARNLITDHHRKQAAADRTRAGLTHRARRTEAPSSQRAGPTDQAEQVALLGQAIETLPAEWREPLTMQVVGKMTSQQIGQVLDTPAGTIRYRITKARRRLAEQLGLIDRPRTAREAEP